VIGLVPIRLKYEQNTEKRGKETSEDARVQLDLEEASQWRCTSSDGQ
jgi:hypothetical protein